MGNGLKSGVVVECMFNVFSLIWQPQSHENRCLYCEAELSFNGSDRFHFLPANPLNGQFRCTLFSRYFQISTLLLQPFMLSYLKTVGGSLPRKK